VYCLNVFGFCIVISYCAAWFGVDLIADFVLVVCGGCLIRLLGVWLLFYVLVEYV